MSFPFDTSDQTPDHRGLFLVQDPALRERILPLFSFDPNAADERPVGHGTAFRIDPWSRCATAFHVLDDLFQVDAAGKAISLRDNLRLAALEVDGRSYGLLPISDDGWRPMAGSYSWFRIDKPFAQPASLRNLVELMLLRIRPPELPETGTPYLPVKLRGAWPQVGDRVMALGYADLDTPRSAPEEADTDRPFRPYLYASIGAISTVEPANPRRDRPWPVLRIDANWPGAMSGGPVFNEDGHVIGIVSTGFEGDGGATATFFAPWDVPERIFTSLDPNNPNRFICWGAFDAAGGLLHAGQDKALVEEKGKVLGAAAYDFVSIDPVTEEWSRSSVTYASYPAASEDNHAY